MDDSELIVHLREFVAGELESESGSENLHEEAQALLAGLERREAGPAVQQDACNRER